MKLPSEHSFLRISFLRINENYLGERHRACQKNRGSGRGSNTASHAGTSQGTWPPERCVWAPGGTPEHPEIRAGMREKNLWPATKG